MTARTFIEDTNNVTGKIVATDNKNMDVLEITMPDSEVVDVGDLITFQDNTPTTIFKGYVQNYTFGNGTKKVIVFDQGAVLSQRTVNKLYTNQSPEAIFEDVVTNQVAGLTYSSTISSGITIATYSAIDKTAWDICQDMAEILLSSFRVSVAGLVTLELIGSVLSSKVITSTIASLEEDWEKDKLQLVNSVKVKGDRQIFGKVETFDGTASATEFTLAEIPEEVKVSISGVEKIGYIPGQGTGDYYVEKENKKIIFDSAPASGTDNISVDYTYNFPITVRRRDFSSITTYGQHDKTIERNYIKTREEARKLCEYILNKFANPLFIGTWIITDAAEVKLFSSYIPNQVIWVTDTDNSINREFIIKVVEREVGKLRITVGDTTSDILFWQKEAQRRIEQLEEKDNNSTILNEDELIVENLLINFTSGVIGIKTQQTGTTCFYDASHNYNESKTYDLTTDSVGIQKSKFPLRFPITLA